MSNPYKHLLSPLKVGKFILKNRMQSSNSLPHFSQGPENYPADPTIAHFVTRARSGAAFITLAGMDDNIDNPPSRSLSTFLISRTSTFMIPSVRITW